MQYGIKRQRLYREGDSASAINYLLPMRVRMCRAGNYVLFHLCAFLTRESLLA